MKTDWKDDIFTRRKLRLEQNDDGTVTPVDETVYTQQGDAFGAKELNEIGEEINEVKKSVSDGKAEIAAAITLKRVTTAASATFHTMAENIKKIVLGSGNAQPADVRKGKTFTNDEGIEKAGTMPEYISGTKGISCGLNDSGLYYYMGAGYWIQDGSGKAWVYMSRNDVAATIGLNPDAMLDSINVLGKQGKIQSMAGATITPQTYKQTVWSAWKRLTGNVEISAVPLPPANVIKKGYRYWIGSNYVDGTFKGYVPTPQDLYLRGNNLYGWYAQSGSRIDSGQITITNTTWQIRNTNSVNLTGYNNLNFCGYSDRPNNAVSVELGQFFNSQYWNTIVSLGSIHIPQGDYTISFNIQNINSSGTLIIGGKVFINNIYRIWLS